MKKAIKKNFTLIEVAVVLLVLVALAGLIVPLAIGYADRAKGSTGAGNLAQLTSNINRFEVENFAMPNGWDNLIDDNGNEVSSAYTLLNLNLAQATSLTAAGITQVYRVKDNSPATPKYTTFGGTEVAATPVDDTLDVAIIPGASVNTLLGATNSAADTYVVFGIGEKITAIGKTLATAPYDFPEGGQKPEESYRRFIAVFNVSGAKAKFVGVLAENGGALSNIQTYINKYYDAN